MEDVSGEGRRRLLAGCNRERYVEMIVVMSVLARTDSNGCKDNSQITADTPEKWSQDPLVAIARY